ncbi:hypothetical protein H9P43_005028 [Blastocladiella emersonii ATCC 22665]|nr:hypothetical protein H9P43_005028 [Blastocladiella emersonii ATCC 22665]
MRPCATTTFSPAAVPPTPPSASSRRSSSVMSSTTRTSAPASDPLTPGHSVSLSRSSSAAHLQDATAGAAAEAKAGGSRRQRKRSSRARKRSQRGGASEESATPVSPQQQPRNTTPPGIASAVSFSSASKPAGSSPTRRPSVSQAPAPPVARKRAPSLSSTSPIRSLLDAALPASLLDPARSPTSATDGDEDLVSAEPHDLRLLHLLEAASPLVPVAVSASASWLVLGCQTGELLLFDPVTFSHAHTLRGHSRAVLTLAAIGTDEELLLSTSADGTVRIWSVSPTAGDPRAVSVVVAADPGSVYAAVRDDRSRTVFLGCQNTSLQWFPSSSSSATPSSPVRPESADDDDGQGRATLAAREFSYFFSPRKLHAFLTPAERDAGHLRPAVIPDAHTLPHAHGGYVYAAAVHPTRPWLITGAGDGSVKIWDISSTTPSLVRTLYVVASPDEDGDTYGDDEEAGVVSLAVARDGSTLYVGCQGGLIAVWDLETTQCLRRLVEHTADVTALEVAGDVLVSGSLDGSIKLWAQRENYASLASVTHSLPVLGLAIARTGSVAAVYDDGTCRVWELPAALNNPPPRAAVDLDAAGSPADLLAGTSRRPSLVGASVDDAPHMVDALLFALRGWIPYRTVSGDPACAEQCRAGAQYLRSILMQLGADATLLPGSPGRNPLVLGRFHAPAAPAKGKAGAKPAKHIVFYGHYDVVPADPTQWETDPFELTGKNGVLYGRGVSDDKGPILAAIFAAAELQEAGQLTSTITFLIEGEEESGSAGLAEAIDAHADLILGPSGKADVILMSNSSWFGERLPCLVYGQRGVVHATVTVEGGPADRHAGVDGGALAAEPLPDLIHLLASLTDPAAPAARRVRIPHFYDGVEVGDHAATTDHAAYDTVVARILDARGVAPANRPAAARDLKQSLIQKWQTPTLTVSRVLTSGGGGEARTVIPHRASATISLRTVPGQTTPQLVEHLCNYLRAQFDAMQAARAGDANSNSNSLKIAVPTVADWWLGSPRDPAFQACARAVHRVWGISPLAVREGGSTLPLHWLRRRLAGGDGGKGEVPVVNVPLAQASDRAHLANECMAVKNLVVGRRALRECLRNLQEL